MPLVEELIKKYRPEIILIGLSLSLIIVSLIIFLTTGSKSQKAEITFSPIPKKSSSDNPIPKESMISVDIAGAVLKPDVYEVSEGARLKDLLALAQGFTKQADQTFFARHFNLAKVLVDQEKIYIPSKDEVEEGMVNEKTSVLGSVSSANSSNSTININTASESELDTLQGVGPKTVAKIIQNRPYQSVDELLSKKVVGQKVFNDIKGIVRIN